MTAELPEGCCVVPGAEWPPTDVMTTQEVDDNPNSAANIPDPTLREYHQAALGVVAASSPAGFQSVRDGAMRVEPAAPSDDEFGSR